MVGEEEREPLASVVVGPAIDNSASVNHPGAKVTSVAYSKEGTYLATADDDGKVLVQDAATSENRPPVTHEGYPVNAIAFSPTDDEKLATAGDDGKVRIWNVKEGSEYEASPINHGDEGNGKVNSVAFSPDADEDEELLATAGDDGMARIWNVTKGKLDKPAIKSPQKKPIKHGTNVHSVAFSPDGKYLATASDDKTAATWKVSGEPYHVANMEHAKEVRGVAFSPDGKYLATASEDGFAHQWVLPQ